MKGALKEFRYWKIVINDFPYGRIARMHHMIVPLRHVTERGLNEQERREFMDIKRDYINKSEYDWILEATKINKSIPDHFHLHLLVGKDE